VLDLKGRKKSGLTRQTWLRTISDDLEHFSRGQHSAYIKRKSVLHGRKPCYVHIVGMPPNDRDDEKGERGRSKPLNQPTNQPPFYGHYTGQLVLAGTSS